MVSSRVSASERDTECSLKQVTTECSELVGRMQPNHPWGLQVRRTYQPDPECVVAALILLLTKPFPSGGTGPDHEPPVEKSEVRQPPDSRLAPGSADHHSGVPLGETHPLPRNRGAHARRSRPRPAP